MKTNSLQIWMCFGIILVCVIAYLIISCIPWDDFNKHKQAPFTSREPFNCPYDIVKVLSTDKIASRVFNKTNPSDNKELLNMFAKKQYGAVVEELDSNMFQTIVDDIIGVIKTNNITSTEAFIKWLSN